MSKAHPDNTRASTTRADDPAYYTQLWDHARLLPENSYEILIACSLIIQLRTLYQRAEAATLIPWPLWGVIHYREATCLPHGSPQDGTPWRNMRSKHTEDHHIFVNWIDAARDCCHNWPTRSPMDPANLAYVAEFHNGMGYRNHGVNSAYLWSMTDVGLHCGKFSEHVYHPNIIDQQAGCMTILLALTKLDIITWPLSTPTIP